MNGTGIITALPLYPKLYGAAKPPGRGAVYALTADPIPEADLRPLEIRTPKTKKRAPV